MKEKEDLNNKDQNFLVNLEHCGSRRKVIVRNNKVYLNVGTCPCKKCEYMWKYISSALKLRKVLHEVEEDWTGGVYIYWIIFDKAQPTFKSNKDIYLFLKEKLDGVWNVIEYTY